MTAMTLSTSRLLKQVFDIEPDTYYKLINGKFVKCDDELNYKTKEIVKLLVD